jgi:hypothetical protein
MSVAIYEGLFFLASIFVAGSTFFICSHKKHGTCDMEKLFGLLVITISFDTGVFLSVHAVQLALQGQKDDAAWVGVAALTLAAFSVKQAIILFQEVYGKKVEPKKIENA